MKTFALTAAGGLAILNVLQLCPAPFLAVEGVLGPVLGGAIGAGGAISGGVGGGVGGAEINQHGRPHSKRADTQGQIPGVPQYTVDMCKQQLQSAKVQVSPAPNSGVRFDGVPPACMDLAGVFLAGEHNDQGKAPVPMGSAAIQYENLSQDELQTLQGWLNAKKPARRGLELVV